ncbi:MAG: ubiquinone biosynthesis regulatory protein kinase UbiB, partial [Marinobacter sp.]
WMRKRIGPSGLIKSLQTHLPAWLEQSPEMPQLVHDALLQLRSAGPTEQQNQDTLTLLREQQLKADRRWRRGITAVVLIAAAVMITLPEAREWADSAPLWSWVLLAGAGALVVRGSR